MVVQSQMTFKSNVNGRTPEPSAAMIGTLKWLFGQKDCHNQVGDFLGFSKISIKSLVSVLQVELLPHNESQAFQFCNLWLGSWRSLNLKPKWQSELLARSPTNDCLTVFKSAYLVALIFLISNLLTLGIANFVTTAGSWKANSHYLFSHCWKTVCWKQQQVNWWLLILLCTFRKMEMNFPLWIGKLIHLKCVFCLRTEPLYFFWLNWQKLQNRKRWAKWWRPWILNFKCHIIMNKKDVMVAKDELFS